MFSKDIKRLKRKFYLIACLAVILSVQFLVPAPDLEQGKRSVLTSMGYDLADISPAAGVEPDRSLRFVVMEAVGSIYDNIVSEDVDVIELVRPSEMNDSDWSRYRLSSAEDNRPAIAIVIDDVGVDRGRSLKATTMLPPEVTLAFLPYAKELDKQTQLARDFGHELIIHFPMEPIGDSDPGPVALLDSMGDKKIDSTFQTVFDSFEGYVGINNHMGSKVTQNRFIMDRVMGQLGGRGLFYLDSRTIRNSVAGKIARQNGVPHAVRDVFLDHEETESFVRDALLKTEEKAKQNGFAIAIGHPKDVTLSIVSEWAQDLDARGFRLVPLSDTILYPMPNVVAVDRARDVTVLEN